MSRACNDRPSRERFNHFAAPENMEKLNAYSSSFRYNSAALAHAPEQDRFKTLEDIKRYVSLADYDRFLNGDLKKYIGVLDVFKNLAFTRNLPSYDAKASVWRIAGAYLGEPSLQDSAIIAQLSPAIRNQVHPLHIRNFFLTFFYSHMHGQLAQLGDIDWTDARTLEELAEVSRILRGAFHEREAGERAGGANPDHMQALQGDHDLGKFQNAFKAFGEKIGIPLAACPNLGALFMVEGRVFEAIGALGIDTRSPLLAFTFDAEKNYATGFANGVTEALSLTDRLHREGIGSLCIKDIKALHKACTDNTLATRGETIENTMGKTPVTYSLCKLRGLTDDGVGEWEADFGELNLRFDHAVKESGFEQANAQTAMQAWKTIYTSASKICDERIAQEYSSQSKEWAEWVKYRARFYGHCNQACKAILGAYGTDCLLRLTKEPAFSPSTGPSVTMTRRSLLLLAGDMMDVDRIAQFAASLVDSFHTRKAMPAGPSVADPARRIAEKLAIDFSQAIANANEAMVESICQGLVNEFIEAVKEARDETNGGALGTRSSQATDREERESMAINCLCQKLERLHPFPDSNGRVFALLLPNSLRLTLGHEVCMPVEPFHYDGASRDELREEVKEGQRRVKSLRANAAQPS